MTEDLIRRRAFEFMRPLSGHDWPAASTVDAAPYWCPIRRGELLKPRRYRVWKR